MYKFSDAAELFVGITNCLKQRRTDSTSPSDELVLKANKTIVTDINI